MSGQRGSGSKHKGITQETVAPTQSFITYEQALKAIEAHVTREIELTHRWGSLNSRGKHGDSGGFGGGDFGRRSATGVFGPIISIIDQATSSRIVDASSTEMRVGQGPTQGEKPLKTPKQPYTPVGSAADISADLADAMRWGGLRAVIDARLDRNQQRLEALIGKE